MVELCFAAFQNDAHVGEGDNSVAGSQQFLDCCTAEQGTASLYPVPGGTVCLDALLIRDRSDHHVSFQGTTGTLRGVRTCP